MIREINFTTGELVDVDEATRSCNNRSLPIEALLCKYIFIYWLVARSLLRCISDARDQAVSCARMSARSAGRNLMNPFGQQAEQAFLLVAI